MAGAGGSLSFHSFTVDLCNAWQIKHKLKLSLHTNWWVVVSLTHRKTTTTTTISIPLRERERARGVNTVVEVPVLGLS